MIEREHIQKVQVFRLPLLVELEFENVGFEEKETPENPKKNLSGQRRTNSKLNPHIASK